MGIAAVDSFIRQLCVLCMRGCVYVSVTTVLIFQGSVVHVYMPNGLVGIKKAQAKKNPFFSFFVLHKAVELKYVALICILVECHPILVEWLLVHHWSLGKLGLYCP